MLGFLVMAVSYEDEDWLNWLYEGERLDAEQIEYLSKEEERECRANWDSREDMERCFRENDLFNFRIKEAQAAIHRFRYSDRAPHPMPLTPTERKVLFLWIVCPDLVGKQYAEDLMLESFTCCDHPQCACHTGHIQCLGGKRKPMTLNAYNRQRENLLRKLGAKSRTHAVTIILTSLIHPPKP
jgi:hypothetical protein